MFEKTIARIEAFAKGMVFDCHTCGQCVLRQTGLICPMSCPKGLRNGPCGGTLNGECEVYPDRPCVWVRIHNRTRRSRVMFLCRYSCLRPIPVFTIPQATDHGRLEESRAHD